MSGALATTAPAASVADAVAAVDAAQAAFEAWSRSTPGVRRAILMKAADTMEAKAAAFTSAMMSETGSTKGWAGFNVHLAAGILREAAALTTQIKGEIIPSDKIGTLALAQRRAKGVCLGIAPWNAPVILGTRAVATALACGNTVVLKASEICPATHGLIVECLAQAGIPAGVINLVTHAPDDAAAVVAALIGHPAVRHVNFTGSTKVGRIIGRLAGEHLKPVLLELGGKAPLIVLGDADLDAAVNAAIFGAFMNQGQICMSTERLIVEDSIADDFVARLAVRANALRAGDPQNDTPLGALAMPGAGALMEEIIDDAIVKGAVLVAGGGVEGAIVQATLLDHVRPGMKVYDEESFGPVKPIVRVSDEAEAVRVANDSDYGLSAAVFSRDIGRAMRVAEQIDSGICHINGPTVGDEAKMPFGGQAAVAEFTDLRWLTIEDPNQHYPI